MEGPVSEIESNLDEILQKYLPELGLELGAEKGKAKNSCDYFTWAHYNVIPLKGSSINLTAYKDLATNVCPTEYYNKVTKAVISANNQNENIMATGYMNNLITRITKAIAGEDSNSSELPIALANYQALNADLLHTVAVSTLQYV